MAKDGNRPPLNTPPLEVSLAALAEALRDLADFSDRPILLVDFAWSFGRDARKAVQREVDADPPRCVLIGNEPFVLPEDRRRWLAQREEVARELVS